MKTISSNNVESFRGQKKQDENYNNIYHYLSMYSKIAIIISSSFFGAGLVKKEETIIAYKITSDLAFFDRLALRTKER